MNSSGRDHLRRGWGQKHYLFFGFVLFLVAGGIVLVSYGYNLTSSSFNARATTSETVYKGILLGWSNEPVVQDHSIVPSISDVYVQKMRVVVITKEIDLWFNFEERLGQDNSFALILPFPVRNISVPEGASVGGSVISFGSGNVTESSSVLQFSWRDLRNFSGWSLAGTELTMYATGNLVSSLKGAYEFYLPVGIYPPADVVQAARNSVPAGLSFPSPPSFWEINFSQISVVLPSNSRLQQVIPSFADVEETADSLILNMQDLFGTSSITVGYNDNNVVDAYQNDLFLGGLWVGIGASVLLSGIFETAKFFYEFETRVRGPSKTEVSSHGSQG